MLLHLFGGSSGGVNSDINVTPMADVMLVLLIIFMLTIPLLQEGVYVNKATARNAREEPLVDEENATMVTVTRQGQVYINRELVPDGQFIEKLIERVALAPELPLFIKGDVAVPYGKVVELVTQARESGVEQIGLMVDRAREDGR
ncbi:MAG: biopolymer transporter ExbD [Gemmatimonadetes bacterium]|nr:biopolymer transporter ExbD [Gemmatimonadota bacterium]